MTRKKKRNPTLHINLVGTGETLEISKVTTVLTSKRMIHFDELDDGTWRLIYNGNHIPDFKSIESIQIKRTGNSEVE